MILRTRIFELCHTDYKNLSELARAMGISVSQVYRVREGKRRINQKFIVGAIKAFPRFNINELFYLVPDSNNHDAFESRDRGTLVVDTAHSRPPVRSLAGIPAPVQRDLVQSQA